MTALEVPASNTPEPGTAEGRRPGFACSSRTSGPRAPADAYGLSAFTRSVLATAVASPGVARCDAVILSLPGLPEATFSVATPAALPATALGVSAFTAILRLPR